MNYYVCIGSVFFLLVLIVALWYFLLAYNGLILLRNNISQSWANIDVLLKQRSDEIPNLVSTVQAYVQHEKKIIENITKARAEYMNAHNVYSLAQADVHLGQAVASLFAVVENYPVLKANQNFMALQTRLSQIEAMIADRREFYNHSVNLFNIKIESLPDMVLAKLMGLRRFELFQINSHEMANMKLTF
jgi:LemA protein